VAVVPFLLLLLLLFLFLAGEELARNVEENLSRRQEKTRRKRGEEERKAVGKVKEKWKTFATTMTTAIGNKISILVVLQLLRFSHC